MKKNLVVALWVLASAAAWGDTPAIFQEADLPLGERLLVDNKCSACHQKTFGDDGRAIYRPGGRINTPGALRGMVELCNTQLGLSLFPEEVTSIAAVLNRDYYHFK